MVDRAFLLITQKELPVIQQAFFYLPAQPRELPRVGVVVGSRAAGVHGQNSHVGVADLGENRHNSLHVNIRC